MGHRGKLAEQQQARQLRRGGLPLAEIAARLGVSKSGVSLWVREVEFEALLRSPRGRRRTANALQRRREAEVDRLLEEDGTGSAGCRSGSSWSRAWRSMQERAPKGMGR